MKFFVENTQGKNLLAILRQAGYRPSTNRKEEISYVHSIRGGAFPRFHLYVEEVKPPMQTTQNKPGWNFNLHLDQKEPTYEGFSAHNGEYEGTLIEEEARRLKWNAAKPTANGGSA